MELIIKAASRSSFIPSLEKEAASGMVPYMHSGEAMPRTLAGISPSAPSRFVCRRPNRAWMEPFAKTEMAEPSTMPRTQ